MAKINEFDLAFIVDTTASMGGLIRAAQQRMVRMVDELSATANAEMRLGVVEYRDFPPQDKMVYRVHDLTSDLQSVKRTINRLRADGGGDPPEAVLAGVAAACERLSWRFHARRMAVLIGDAPPHGIGAGGDGFPEGCPSGETMESVAAKAEEHRITLYALGLTGACAASFERISRLTGGRLFRADQGEDAMRRINEILEREFGQLDFDRAVHDAWAELGDESSDALTDQIADKIGSTPPKVASAVCRLQSRGFMTADATM